MLFLFKIAVYLRITVFDERIVASVKDLFVNLIQFKVA